MARLAFKYNPGFSSDSEIEENFVVRIPDFKLLLEVIRSNSFASSNRHALVVGPRGSGKTTLLRRIVAELRSNKELERLWLPVVYGEESYNITTTGEIWLEAIYHLQKQVDDSELKQALTQLKQEQNEKQLQEKALEFLISYSRHCGRRLILVVENLNMVFDQQMSDDQGWILRHALQNVPEIMLLATATTSFDEIEKSDRALFEQFKTHFLRPLTTRECASLWNHYSGEKIPAKKIRPIQILTGGSPRLLRVLADYAVENSFFGLQAKLSILVDQYTDYFKSQLEVLPTKERKVFVTLLELWDPVTTKRVSESSRIPLNTVSALLGRLNERGAITKVSNDGPPLWQAAERLFNIYYLMRRRGAPSSRVHALVKFMTVYYESDQLVERAVALAREACALSPQERGDHFIALSEIIQNINPRKRREVLKIVPEEIVRDPTTPSEFSLLWEGADHDIIASDPEAQAKNLSLISEPASFLKKVLIQIDKGEVDQARQMAESRLVQKPSDSGAFMVLGLTSSLRGDPSEAEGYYRKAAKLDSSSDVFQALVGESLVDQKKFKEALEFFDGAIRLAPSKGEYWRKRALLLERVGGDKAKIECNLKKAVELEPDKAVAWISLGKWMWRRKSAEQALESIRKAVEVEKENSKAWETLADVLQELKNFEEAEQAIVSAKKYDPDAPMLWSKHADIVRHDEEREADAISYFEKAVDLSKGEKRADVLVAFARFLDTVHKHDRAETLLRDATVADPSLGTAWYSLGIHLSAYPKKVEEAELALRKATEVSPGWGSAWSQLGLLLDRNGHVEAAEQALRKGAEFSKDTCAPIYLLGKFMREHARDDEAAELLRSAIGIRHDCSCAAECLSQLLTKQGKAGEAEDLLRKLVSGAPHSARAQYVLAQHLAEFDFEQAKKAYLEALRLKGKKSAIAEGLTSLVLRSKLNEAAKLEELKKVSAMIRVDCRALNEMAWRIHMERDNFCSSEMLDFALSLSRDALNAQPGTWEFQHTLGALLCDAKRIPTALTEVKDLADNVDESVLDDFIELCVEIARVDRPGLLAVLEQADSKEIIEPLIVALKLALGQKVHVAQEILEVAKDLLSQMNERGEPATK